MIAHAALMDLEPLIWCGRKPRRLLPRFDPLQQVTIDMAVAAIDVVVAFHPEAVWAVSSGLGRVEARGQGISRRIAVQSPEAELTAWADAANRLTTGYKWDPGKALPRPRRVTDPVLYGGD